MPPNPKAAALRGLPFLSVVGGSDFGFGGAPVVVVAGLGTAPKPVGLVAFVANAPKPLVGLAPKPVGATASASLINHLSKNK